MEDTVELEIDTRELERALAAMPQHIAGKVMRDALQAGGDVLLEAMVAHAPERTDEPTPESRSLPPGILKADLHTEIQIRSNYPPRVKVGPSSIAGHVARWQENGWMLTGHGKRGRRKKIRQIPGKHFMAAAFDESAERAVEVFLNTLADALGKGSLEGVGAEDNYSGENY